MITKKEALTATAFHYTGHHACTRTIGPRGGITECITLARRAGETQTWKRSPERFRVPVRHGLYGYGEITEHNATDWHTAESCDLEEIEID